MDPIEKSTACGICIYSPVFYRSQTPLIEQLDSAIMAQQTLTPTILLGIGGGISAYKAVEVASTFHKKGIETHVAMTRAAQRFVTPLTFSAITGNPVLNDIFPQNETLRESEDNYPHLYPATRADICAILPATANMIGNIAHGLGNDIVSTSVLSLSKQCRRFYCPAMNVEMWNQQSVQRNLQILDELGWKRIGPYYGSQACGSIGVGRMAEPSEIAHAILEEKEPLSLQNKAVLILSGPTIEAIDPVRFISNHSSGKMGKALAEAAMELGAKVEFITGPISPENDPQGLGNNIYRVNTANEMLERAEEIFPKVEIAIFAAAVADYSPATPSKKKLPKSNDPQSLELAPTPDIAAILGKRKQEGQICIGFAVECKEKEYSDASALAKMKKKNFDSIILNGIDSFNSQSGHFHFFQKAAKQKKVTWGKISKSECASRIFREIINTHSK